MNILLCIPVMCLHGPHLLVSCNVHISWRKHVEVHISWNHMRGSKHLMVTHIRKYTSCGSTCVEVHVSGKHTHGSKRLVVARTHAHAHTHIHTHTQKYTSHENKSVEVCMLKVHNSHIITYLPSLLHYITPIFFWFTSTNDTDVTHHLFSIAHIKTWWIK